MWKTTIRGLLAHKLRLVLTAVSVLLGVSFVSGTFVLTDTMGRAFDEVMGNAFGGVDVSVRSRQAFEGSPTGPSQMRDTIPQDLLATVRAVDGVARAEGSIGGFAQIVDKTGKAVTTSGAPTLGVSWDAIGSPLTMRSGRPPAGPSDVVIDARTAETHGFVAGDKVKILLSGPAQEFTITGITGFGDADNLAGATLAAFEVSTAQRALDREGRFDFLNVEAAQGTSPDELATRVGAALPKGYEAVTGAQAANEESDSIKQGLSFFNTALLAFGAVALFVGAFIVSNTFSMIVAQRAREFGLLRAVGASQGQVLRSVLVEALIVGLVSSALGVVAGIGLAAGLRALLASFGMELPKTGTVVLPRTVIVGLVVGVVVTVVSAIAPARKASRVSPVEAITHGLTGPAGLTTRRRIVGGLVLLAGGGALLGIGLAARDVGRPIINVGAGAVIVFLAVTMLSPVVARPLARIIGWPASKLRGIPGRLAQGNAARAPRRTAATAAALMVGLALVSFVAVLGSSIKASFDDTIGQSLRADLIVQQKSRFSGFGFSPDLARSLEGTEEIGAASALREGSWRDAKAVRSLAAVDPDSVEDVIDMDLGQGRARGLGPTAVLVHEDAAEDRSLRVGDGLVMEFAKTGVQQFTVAGIYGEGQILGSYVISLASYEQNFVDQQDSIVFLKAAPNTSVASAQAAANKILADFPNADVENREEFSESQASQVNTILTLVTGLLLLAILIAVLGIINTLALSVVERTRELGLLRAVGMARRQMRSMIRWESVIVAVLGAILGVVVGILFGWAVVATLSDEPIGDLVVPVGQLAIYVGLSAVAGVIAAIIPARRASRLDVLQAIATE